MNSSFSSRFTGGSFVAAALMYWLGWLLLPVRIGTFFEPGVFGGIHDHFHFWIWTYRVHLFGMIVSVIALFALAALVADSPSRILVWPGMAVASLGMAVSALAAAFYYHHGAWGSIELAGKTPAAAQAFVEALRVDTEYVTCLVRFGRVFTGLGLVVLAWGILRFQILPTWSGIGAGIIGLGAMALTMGLPDHLSYYLPIFHATVAWMLATGVVVFRGGMRAPQTDAQAQRQA